MDDMFVDMLNLGKIFRVEDRAEKLVDGYRKQLAEIQAKVARAAEMLFRTQRISVLEDGSVQSASSLTCNLRVGYRVDARNRLSLDVFNVFNTRSNDIEYFYESRLKGESAPVWDRHVHPAEPRLLRLSWSHRFD